MKCQKCSKKITVKEWLFSVHKLFEQGYCEECEKEVEKKWINSQIKLIKTGKRLLPKVC